MLVIDEKQCLKCAGCITFCPELALWMSRRRLEVDQSACTACELCVRFCPVLALSLDDQEAA